MVNLWDEKKVKVVAFVQDYRTKKEEIGGESVYAILTDPKITFHTETKEVDQIYINIGKLMGKYNISIHSKIEFEGHLKQSLKRIIKQYGDEGFECEERTEIWIKRPSKIKIIEMGKGVPFKNWLDNTKKKPF